MCASVRSKNPNKSNIQRRDSLLRARGLAQGGEVCHVQKQVCNPTAVLRSVLTQGQRLAGSAGQGCFGRDGTMVVLISNRE